MSAFSIHTKDGFCYYCPNIWKTIKYILYNNIRIKKIKKIKKRREVMTEIYDQNPKVYVCKVWNSIDGEAEVLGVFTSLADAVYQGSMFIDSCSMKKAKQYDRGKGFLEEIIIYYKTEDKEDTVLYTLTLEPFYLDKLINYV